ncbi:MAG TPA: flagellar hook-associated protein FlgL [Bacillota bacterium]|nr:flagellar hook-associated protein FlgL [Bacillota bacterium]
MRVTQGMLSNNMLRNLMNSQERMSTYLEQLSTGKKISRPSQDPVVAVKGINYRKQVGQLEQYQRNTSELHNWLDNTDEALDKSNQALQRIRELVIQVNNDHYGPDEKESIRKEISQLQEHLVDVANTNVNGKYIFNGTGTDTKPVTYDGNIVEVVHVNQDAFEIAVSPQTKLQANVKPEEVFPQELFDDLNDIMRILDGDDDVQGDLNDSIIKLDKHINNTLDTRAEIGARMNRLDLIENRLEEQEVIATRTMAENENVHMEETITNLITQESLHRAALAAGSRIIQPTLIDFLR